MGNKIFQAILNEKIEKFKFAFQQTSKNIFWDELSQNLIHPGEYGTYREAVCKEYLRVIIPTRLEIGNGFLINAAGDVSTQCDIVVFDRNSTPLIENDNRQRFFPVETVCAIGEVKSDMSKTDFKIAINKLSRNKRLKEKIDDAKVIKRDHSGNFNCKAYPYDNIFSFMICNRLAFDFSELVNEIDSMYDSDIQPWQKHNMILSIADGLLVYYDSNSKSLMYPSIREPLKNRLLKSDKNIDLHFQVFSSYIFMGTSAASIYFPEMVNYLVNVGDEKNIDQK